LLLVDTFCGLALRAPRLVHHPLENPHDSVRIERTGQRCCRLSHLCEDLLFAIRLIDRHAQVVLQAPDFHRARDAHVQEAHQLVVDHVDPPAQLLYRQDFSQRPSSSTRRARSGEPPASAMRLTRALPTTAASAHRPTSLTCSGFEIPNPSATGSVLCLRMRATISSAPGSIESRAPVTPSREIA